MVVRWYMRTIGSSAWWYEREQRRLDAETPIEHQTSAESHLWMAEKHLQSYWKSGAKEDLAGVASHVSQAMQKDPEASIVLEDQGITVTASYYAYLALYSEAQILFRSSLNTFAHLDTEALDDALSAIDKALTYRSDQVKAWELKALILFNTPARGTEARQFLNSALRRFPGDTSLLKVRDTFTR